MVGNRLDRTLLEAADGGFGIVSIVQFITIPGMTERVVLGRALRVHDNDVVRVFEPARERLRPPAYIESFIVGQGVNGLRTNGVERVALRTGNRHAEHEGLALLDGADAA